MCKEKILEILENAKDGNGAVPMRLVRTAFDKLPEPCEDTISRQEAIDAINSWRGRFSEEYNEAIDDCENSIKELPTIQPEKAQHSQECATSDMISRQEAIDRFNVIRPVDPKKDEYTKGIDVGMAMCIVAVKDQPSAQPEPHEGHWIPHESPDGGEQYECSRCGVLWEFNDGTPEDNEAYFCPKCGKKMKGERDE